MVAAVSPLELHIIDPDHPPTFGVHHLLVQDVCSQCHFVPPEIGGSERFPGPIEDDGEPPARLCYLCDRFPRDEQVFVTRPGDAQLAHPRMDSPEQHHQVLDRPYLSAAVIENRATLQARQGGDSLWRFFRHTDRFPSMAYIV